MEVSEVGLIERYVATGFGYGVALQIPGIPWSDQVRAIPLPANDFGPVVVGILHTGNLKSVAANFVEVAKKYAVKLMKSA